MSKHHKICLNMIVKNELSNIERCLKSVAPFIDCWVIGDTGSSDGTQQWIKDFFSERNIPGELHDFEFVDFSQARNEALERARGSSLIFDYLLLTDADMELRVHDKDFAETLDADIYRILQRSGISYWNSRLLRRSATAYYVGVTHEYLHVESDHLLHLSGCEFADHGTGSNRVNKYDRDIALITRALQTEESESLRARYIFYLANSYRDHGQIDKALEHYLLRSKMGHWDQEIYISLYNAGIMMEKLDRSAQEILSTYAAATASCTWRAEALHNAARYCRHSGNHQLGYQFAKQGLCVPYPEHGLFVEDWIYKFGLLDELAVTSYWLGQYEECDITCQRLLTDRAVPGHYIERIKQNQKFARSKIKENLGRTDHAYSQSDWEPSVPLAGTELMIRDLRAVVPEAFEAAQLEVNIYPSTRAGSKPLVLWMHHDINQQAVQWCSDRALVEKVDLFVFVSYWQLERYCKHFQIPPSKCVVLKNATTVARERRIWSSGNILRFAYTSTPFRGLSVLLDAWDDLSATGVELHIWSSMKLYRANEEPYIDLIDRAKTTKNVYYRGLLPREDLKSELRKIHFLAYPSTFEETSCMAAIDAMAEGCRLIVPSLGALPETAWPFAHIYPFSPDPTHHRHAFVSAIKQELENPWHGNPGLSLSQQSYCEQVYDWRARAEEWRRIIKLACRI